MRTISIQGPSSSEWSLSWMVLASLRSPLAPDLQQLYPKNNQNIRIYTHCILYVALLCSSLSWNRLLGTSNTYGNNVSTA